MLRIPLLAAWPEAKDCAAKTADPDKCTTALSVEEL